MEQRRGSSSERGYDGAWKRFRERYLGQLAGLGIPLICGSALPDGPPTGDASECRQQGLVTGDNLHLDHYPPLAPLERLNRRAVCDPRRVRLLCGRCHSRLTARQQAGAR